MEAFLFCQLPHSQKNGMPFATMLASEGRRLVFTPVVPEYSEPSPQSDSVASVAEIAYPESAGLKYS